MLKFLTLFCFVANFAGSAISAQGIVADTGDEPWGLMSQMMIPDSKSTSEFAELSARLESLDHIVMSLEDELMQSNSFVADLTSQLEQLQQQHNWLRAAVCTEWKTTGAAVVGFETVCGL